MRNKEKQEAASGGAESPTCRQHEVFVAVGAPTIINNFAFLGRDSPINASGNVIAVSAISPHFLRRGQGFPPSRTRSSRFLLKPSVSAAAYANNTKGPSGR